jgi:biopolymer transport protein ExbD
MKLPPPRRSSLQLNLMPLLDVVFILLIFVVLVARFVDQERIDVDVPTSTGGRQVQEEALVLTLEEAGQVVIEGRTIGPEQLPHVLKAAHTRHERAVLVADQAIPLQAAVDVLSAAREAGFTAVALATRPPR